MTTQLTGVCGSRGYGYGRAMTIHQGQQEPIRQSIADADAERTKLKAAREVCGTRIKKLATTTEAELGKKDAGIFLAHLEVLQDDAFFQRVLDRVTAERLNVEFLIYDECRKVIERFALIDDPYLNERASDIEQVCGELIGYMLGASREDTSAELTDDVIVVADKLSPADIMRLDHSRLRGIITQRGGKTSHTVIIAKALGIPLILGVADAVRTIRCGDVLILDACAGTVGVNPETAVYTEFCARAERHRHLHRQCELEVGLQAVTRDGMTIRVNVNVGDENSICRFNEAKCDGIGLFRTEFLYMGRKDPPTEDEQFAFYQQVAKRADGKEVIIRTLDIGGDKQAECLNLPPESNPFLGYRAIRICLVRRELFHTQLRAILRASHYGNIKIMFPMIVTLEEFRTARECVEQAKVSLRTQGVPFKENIEIGMMIETPAAVLLSAEFAREADFFSIGSNDLIQYITATDRMNERVQYLYDSCNASVLRAIHMVAKNASAAGIPWGICGEIASEEMLIPLWVAWGVSELSVTQSAVGLVKRTIRAANYQELQDCAKRILSLATASEIRSALTSFCSDN